MMKTLPLPTPRLRSIVFALIAAWHFTLSALAQKPAADLRHEAFLFTPTGFEREGKPAWIEGADTGEVRIVVRAADSDKPTPCRVNVVGADGSYYQPVKNRLSPFALTSRWPAEGGWGNRIGKAPFRYIGHFFYMAGETAVRVPAGPVRVEVWKGLEHRPQVVETTVTAGGARKVEVTIPRAAPMAPEGYYAGDTHLHFPRKTAEDDRIVFDLLDAEDLRFGCCLAYNHPPGPYAGFMESMTSPQHIGIGERTLRSRGAGTILSGQEYRSRIYGHLKLYLLDDLVFPGRSFNSDEWPVHGVVGRDAMAGGGFAVAAHGGYAAEIYADAALGAISAVELLQFGVYRGIELQGWYDMLNAGYRFAALGASDYPPCRTLADCRTYVYHDAPSPPTMREWLDGMASGRSFCTTGPLLLLEVDDRKPGAQIHKSGAGPHTVRARVRVRCEVTPVTDIDLIVNGRVVKHHAVSRAEGQGRWIEIEHDLALTESSWIAARAHSTAPIGKPDAESHTNPVYVYLDNRTPFERAALDAWVARIDDQLARQTQRKFAERAQVLAYYQNARDVLLKIRAQNGLAADEDPRKLAEQTDAAQSDNLTSFLKPVPPKSPEEALATFETLPGFHMELVAAEPLVRSPIAAAFDENGVLYVAEMRDYPYNGDQPVKVARQRPSEPGEPLLGAVRLLRDTDGDGRFDESHVFADNLLWPAGIAPWKGGVFVCAPPHIWYLKDTDGDFKADVRRPVLTGFGSQNQQAMVNNLKFGLDHMIYASAAGNGGDIRPGDAPGATPVSVNGHDFSFDPESGRLALQSGTKQFGLSFDDWGNRFLCSQSEPCAQVVLPLNYLQRNPHFAAPATIFRTTPSPTPIHRISPIERWRHIRSSRRVTEGVRAADSEGVSHHVVDAAAGITVYRGGAYPAEFYGNVFVGDGQNNLVHRRVLEPAGAVFKSERVDVNTEFVRSSDIWFRPVNFVNAPDGTLYCIDMSREYLETVNIPPDVEEHLDLTSGRDQGRIYRIAPDGFRVPPPPRLGHATTAELVAALEHPHGWWRDTASRLLYERQDQSAVPALTGLAIQSGSPAARVQALWALRGLGALDDETILFALGATHPGVRKNAVRLAEPRLDSSAELRAGILALVDDPEPQVRLQVGFAIGESRQWDQAAALARIVRDNPDDTWIHSAVLSSSAHCGGKLFAALAADARHRRFQRRLLTAVGAQNQAADVARAIDALAGIDDVASALPLANALGEGLKRAGNTLAVADKRGQLKVLLERTPRIAGDATQHESLRRAAVEALVHHPYAEAAPVLLMLLEPSQPPALQLAAIDALGAFSDPRLGAELLKRLETLSPAARSRALDVILQRTERIETLWVAIANNTLRPSDLNAEQTAALQKHPDERVRQRAAALLGAAVPVARADVYKSFLPVLQLVGDPERGRLHFETRCAACHNFAGLGHAFGPDLAAARTGGKEKLLTGFIDPNREMLPQFAAYSVATKDGENVTGILKSETATTVTLGLPGGLERTVPRAALATMQSLGRSIMPEGLEAGLKAQDVADLIEFIVASP